MAKYQATSPYFSTSQAKGYLDVINWRTVPADVDDILFTITKSYEYRPDLLAYDLYQDVTLWWVFSVRNPSVLQDPVFDMVPGIQIYLPKLSNLKAALGF